ncbi:MAG TPA: DinB family protein [Ktedonobacterales bacterium]
MPTTVSLAERLCATLEQERADFMPALTAASAETLDRKGVVGQWSVKNVLAHLAAWELVAVQVLSERLETGQTPEIMSTISADMDAWNAMQVDEVEDLSPEDQLVEFEWTRSLLLQYLASLDDATLAKAKPWSGWDGTVAEYVLEAICAHERAHADQVLAGLAAAG